MQVGQAKATVCQGGNLQPKVLFVDTRNLLQPHQLCMTGVVFHQRGVECCFHFGVLSIQGSLLVQQLASNLRASMWKEVELCNGLMCPIMWTTFAFILFQCTLIYASMLWFYSIRCHLGG